MYHNANNDNLSFYIRCNTTDMGEKLPVIVKSEYFAGTTVYLAHDGIKLIVLYDNK